MEILGFLWFRVADPGSLYEKETNPILATRFHPEIKENNQGILVLEFFLENMLFHEGCFGL